MLVQLWVAGEGPTIEWSHVPRKIVREETILPKPWRLYLLVLKVVASLGYRGNTFPWTHLKLGVRPFLTGDIFL